MRSIYPNYVCTSVTSNNEREEREDEAEAKRNRNAGRYVDAGARWRRRAMILSLLSLLWTVHIGSTKVSLRDDHDHDSDDGLPGGTYAMYDTIPL